MCSHTHLLHLCIYIYVYTRSQFTTFSYLLFGGVGDSCTSSKGAMKQNANRVPPASAQPGKKSKLPNPPALYGSLPIQGDPHIDPKNTVILITGTPQKGIPDFGKSPCQVSNSWFGAQSLGLRNSGWDSSHEYFEAHLAPNWLPLGIRSSFLSGL